MVQTIKVKKGKGVKVGKSGANAGGIANKKLKCWMGKANGKVYRTCATPAKAKMPKQQVRGKPRVGGKGGEKAYPSADARKKEAKNRGVKARAEKSGDMTFTKSSTGVTKRIKMKNKPKKPRTEAQKKATAKLVAMNKAKKGKK